MKKKISLLLVATLLFSQDSLGKVDWIDCIPTIVTTGLATIFGSKIGNKTFDLAKSKYPSLDKNTWQISSILLFTLPMFCYSAAQTKYGKFWIARLWYLRNIHPLTFEPYTSKKIYLRNVSTTAQQLGLTLSNSQKVTDELYKKTLDRLLRDAGSIVKGLRTPTK